METENEDYETDESEDAAANQTSETEGINITYFQTDPEVVVEKYLESMTAALDGDESKYEDAFALLSPHAKKNTHWMNSIGRFRLEANRTYEIYDHGGVVREHIESREFGDTFRIYFNSDQGDVFYIIQNIDGLWYIASGSKMGSMFWRKE